MLFYSSFQNSYTFNFYVNDASGKLSAEIIDKEGRKERAILIKGLPWQDDLCHNQWRIAKVKQALEQSFFTKVGSDVVINVRGRGGWGDDIHSGVQKFSQPRKSIPIENGDGTYSWGMFCGFSEQNAGVIADACLSVDDGETHPAPVLMPKIKAYVAQGWHFNVNAWSDEEQRSSNGTAHDSRIIHSVDMLKEAIRLANENDNRTLSFLGRGLHPLQDVFAHCGAFVTVPADRESLNPSLYLFSHLNKKGDGADEPKCIDEMKNSPLSSSAEDRLFGLSQRYSDTKTISILYLLLYGYNTNKKFIDRDTNLDTLAKIIICRLKYYKNLDGVYRNLMDGFNVPGFITIIRSNGIAIPPGLEEEFGISLRYGQNAVNQREQNIGELLEDEFKQLNSQLLRVEMQGYVSTLKQECETEEEKAVLDDDLESVLSSVQ